MNINLTNNSLLVQQAHGSICAAESLAHAESDFYDPNEMSWLTTQGHDYFFRSYNLLRAITLQLVPHVFSEGYRYETVKYDRECDLAPQAMELGSLFVNNPEKVERRKELVDQIIRGLKVFHDERFTLFKSFIQKFSDYVTRDISMSEKSPVLSEMTLENGMVVIVEEHSVYTLIRPKNDEQRTRLFVSIPHNGTQLPPEDLELRQKPANVVHSDSDLYLREVWSQDLQMVGP